MLACVGVGHGSRSRDRIWRGRPPIGKLSRKSDGDELDGGGGRAYAVSLVHEVREFCTHPELVVAAAAACRPQLCGIRGSWRTGRSATPGKAITSDPIALRGAGFQGSSRSQCCGEARPCDPRHEFVHSAALSPHLKCSRAISTHIASPRPFLGL